MKDNTNFNQNITKSIFIVLLMTAGFAVIIMNADFFLTLFAGIFFSVLLNYSSGWFSEKLKIKYKYSLFLVIFLMLLFFTGLILIIGPSVSQQIDELTIKLPELLNQLKENLSNNKYGAMIMKEIPDNPGDLIKDKAQAATQVFVSFAAALSIIGTFGFIIVTGIFLAFDPGLYTRNFIRLFPVAYRNKISDVMDKVYHILSLWMTAKFFSITIIGILAAIGLQILGIPLPYVLALILALFAFIPNLGTLLALIPAVLMASTKGVDKIVYVIILYLTIELLESYVITPFFEKKMVALPPALTLLWMLLFGILTGFFGLILATPILAALIVIVSELYVKGYLEKGKADENYEKQK